MSSVVPQVPKLLCLLSAQPNKVPLRALPTSGHHTLPRVSEASHEKQLSVLVPLIIGLQAMQKAKGKQMLAHALCLHLSHSTSSRAQEGTEEREVVCTGEASRPPAQSDKMPSFIFISFHEGSEAAPEKVHNRKLKNVIKRHSRGKYTRDRK